VKIGARTTVAAFARICAGARVGAACEIGEHVLIAGGVEIGDRVTIASGAKLASGVRIEDDVSVGANATLTSQPSVRGARRAANATAAVIRAGASIGANATILPDVVIGRTAAVEAGAVVTRNVPPNAIVTGNPAQLQGYVDSIASTGPLQGGEGTSGARKLAVKAVALNQLPLVRDIRGNLSVAEIGKGLPFAPRRYFVITDVPNDKVRGEHAHRKLRQFLVCLRGRCSVLIDDGKRREEVVLDRPELGLYVPPMVWAVQYKYSADAVLLVLASAAYDAADYIRDYDEFLRLIRQR
jgi:UDP-2-acetamido-3-amino-2,3-dideoxy-glucuronate N-acetyltransferase